LLFEQYAGKMMSVCRRYANDQKEADDMLQESFLRVYQYIGQYKFKGAFGGWIRRITVNASLRVLQSRKFHFEALSNDEDYRYDQDDLDACAHLNAEELLRLISRLPDGYRIVFNLFALEGYTHEEIAQMLKIKPVTSRTQLLKARKLLQEQIQILHKSVNE
jgi:RNA polymerase sigma-70 factor (ECF subfamily)